MKHWMKAPTWVGALFERRQDDWFDWMSQSSSREFCAEIQELFADGPPDFLIPPLYLEASVARLQRSVPLAYGRLHKAFDLPVDYRPVWWFDPEQPDVLWLAISENSPPIFWLPVAPDDQAIAAAIQANFVDELLPVANLLGHCRLFAGTADQLQMELENFENHFVMTAPVSSHMWGSEFEYDPWPADSRDWSMIDKTIELRRVMNQREGRVRRTNFRTTFSRSVVTVEDYNGLFVFDLRYAPQAITGHVAPFNTTYHTLLPEDAPVDVVCALLGFLNMPAATIVEAIDQGDFAYLPGDLEILGVLEPNGLQRETWLRRWFERADDLDVRRALTSAANLYGLDNLLFERWDLEPDLELRNAIASVLGYGDLT